MTRPQYEWYRSGMNVLLFMASLGRCADPAFCPSNEELIGAVSGYDTQLAFDVINRGDDDDPATIIVPPTLRRITGLDDVSCGHLSEGAVPCSFTVRYWDKRISHIDRLVRNSDGWTIVDARLTPLLQFDIEAPKVTLSR